MAGPSEAGSERPQLSPRRNHKPILSTQHQNGGTVNCFHVYTSHCGNILLWPEWLTQTLVLHCAPRTSCGSGSCSLGRSWMLGSGTCTSDDIYLFIPLPQELSAWDSKSSSFCLGQPRGVTSQCQGTQLSLVQDTLRPQASSRALGFSLDHDSKLSHFECGSLILFQHFCSEFFIADSLMVTY